MPSSGIMRPLCIAASFDRSRSVKSASIRDCERLLRAIAMVPFTFPLITVAFRSLSNARSLLISTFAVAAPSEMLPTIPPPMLISADAR